MYGRLMEGGMDDPVVLFLFVHCTWEVLLVTL